MSIWEDIINKGKEIASEAVKSSIPTITETIGETVSKLIDGKKEEDKK